MAEKSAQTANFTEPVELKGHIIDSLLLPKVLDIITERGGSYRLKKVQIGQTRSDPSSVLIEVESQDAATLQQILGQIMVHGAVPVHARDCTFQAADVAKAFPEGFYSSTNQRTQIRHGGEWIEVQDQEMDCGVLFDPATKTARCIPMTEVTIGDQLVVGHGGVKVIPLERAELGETFEFMSSDVSTEKPKGVTVRQLASDLHQLRARGGRVLFVGGPAIVHTGSGPYLCELIRRGYVQILFAGNALATHDIEQSIYGTSLGVNIDKGSSVEAGHEHHLRAINTIRRAGSIAAAVENGIIKSGVMYECVKHDVPFVLCGSIRDDGPLPDVITDVLVSQQEMRRHVRNLDFCLMVATTLHSIAVGNLLPAWVKVVCVDINPSTVIKLNDRGSFQTIGLVTDVEPFLRALVAELDKLEAK
jgi:lysine-ketoglutarate reductase/saccharopine dehydrogenase-like protein (TIGR00300 family)